MANTLLRKVTTIKKLSDLAASGPINEIRYIKDHFAKTKKKAKGTKRINSGYKVLFYGLPGTEKTKAAAVIGNEIKQPVYRIDLSKIVSKYIGETEKNLEKIFARAEDKGWVLFFDEADALFGKRTTVKDSHDKYANQEVSYLLQKIEGYTGLVILSTNMKKNIDSAFMRRFNSVISFPKD